MPTGRQSAVGGNCYDVGSELPGSQSKMRNTFKLCTLIIKHGEDLLVSQEEVCVVVQMLLLGLQQVCVSS